MENSGVLERTDHKVVLLIVEVEEGQEDPGLLEAPVKGVEAEPDLVPVGLEVLLEAEVLELAEYSQDLVIHCREVLNVPDSAVVDF